VPPLFIDNQYFMDLATDTHGAIYLSHAVRVTTYTVTGHTQLVYNGDSRTAGTEGVPYPIKSANAPGSTNYGDFSNIAVYGTGSSDVLKRIPTIL
jgi:hypothetical protein